VVHVTSQGGLVVANLQQSTVRGIDPGGVDVVGATTAPATTNVIPGVVIAGGEATAAQLGNAGFEDLKTALRVYVPGANATGDAVGAQVDVIPEDGTTTGASFTIDVTGGLVSDLPIDELADGSYTVRVVTDAPAVVGIRTSTVGSEASGGATDFAWLAAAPLLQDAALVSIPAFLTGALHLQNPGTADTTVQVTAINSDGSAGATTAVAVAAGSAVNVPVEANLSYRLEGFDSLYASASITSDGGLSGITVAPPAESSRSLVVYP
jgi:hypothetical protein